MSAPTHSIGIDIGGTKIAAGLMDPEGTIVAKARRSTPFSQPSAVFAEVGDLIDELSAHGHPVSGVGVACAGYVDKVGSTVFFAPNLAWRDEPLKARLSARTTLPVLIENDANAAAYGEFVYGAGRDVSDMVMLTIGTGVGGGIINDGKLFRGAYGLGGEIGHMRMVPNGHLCGCGNRGCVETYASGSALVREARELVRTGSPHAAALVAACGGDADALTGAQITSAAQAGDAAAAELISDLGTWIGEAAASLAALLDPQLFVIGGGVADAGDLLFKPVQRAFARQLTGRGYRPEPEFAVAELGNDAGMIGAAKLAQEMTA